MTQHELFEKTFSALHASPDTISEVKRTMQNEKKTRRILGRGAVIAIAAALTLTVAMAAGVVTLIKANVSPADKVDDTTYHAFTDDMDASTPTVEGNSGELITLPDMERIPGDRDTVQRLVGDYLSKLDAELTVGSTTITLETFLVDESGCGILTYTVDDPEGVSYEDAGYGEVYSLPLNPSMYLHSPDFQQGGGAGAGFPVQREGSGGEQLHGFCRNVLLRDGFVNFGDVMAGGGHAVDEFSVVREEKQAGSFFVQPSYRRNRRVPVPPLEGQQVVNQIPLPVVMAAGVPFRFVKGGVQAVREFHRFSVQQDAFRLHLVRGGGAWFSLECNGVAFDPTRRFPPGTISVAG